MKNYVWHPIDSAPKNGCLIDVWQKEHIQQHINYDGTLLDGGENIKARRIVDVYWFDVGTNVNNINRSGWAVNNSLLPEDTITHWMPRPDAPGTSNVAKPLSDLELKDKLDQIKEIIDKNLYAIFTGMVIGKSTLTDYTALKELLSIDWGIDHKSTEIYDNKLRVNTFAKEAFEYAVQAYIKWIYASDLEQRAKIHNCDASNLFYSRLFFLSVHLTRRLPDSQNELIEFKKHIDTWDYHYE